MKSLEDSIKRERPLYESNSTNSTLEERFVDDQTIFADVEISHLSSYEYEPIGSLVKRFTKAGIPSMVKDIT